MTHENSPRVLEGSFVAPSTARFAIVAARFNAVVVDRLLEGALDGLRRHGVSSEQIAVVRVPGSWEIPLVCARLARSKKFEAIIALGAVIRGATAHFDHVAGQVASGVGRLSLEQDVPVVFGVLTTDSIEQAVERAGSKAGNKGFDAALSAIEMVSLAKALDDAGF